MLRTIAIICLLVLSCEENEIRSTANRPSDSDEDVDGYLAETTQSVSAGEAVTITISSTNITIPENGLRENAKVRLRVLKVRPQREDVASLGEAKGDIVEITMYNENTEEVFASNLLDLPFAVNQDLSEITDEANLKYVVISSPDTDEEKVQLLGRKAISTGVALTTSDLSVSIELNVTHVIFFAVESAATSSTVTIIDSGKDTSNDSVGTVSSSSTSSSSSGSGIDCSDMGDGWIGVAKNDVIGQTLPFCVMKYEAKKVTVDGIDTATSQASGTPWVSIQRGENDLTESSAMKACRDLGEGFTLITNAMWQTIARNIETAQDADGNYINWSNGSNTGNNAVNRGHSDNAPSLALAVTNASDPCSGTGQSNCSNRSVNLGDSGDAARYSQKRTHSLSNGKIIWDFAGNIWEWIADDISGASLPGQVTPGWHEYTNPSIFPSDPGGNRLKFAPLGDFDGSQGMGALYGGASGAVVRGGSYDNSANAGVFAAFLAKNPSNSTDPLGFRCARPIE